MDDTHKGGAPKRSRTRGTASSDKQPVKKTARTIRPTMVPKRTRASPPSTENPTKRVAVALADTLPKPRRTKATKRVSFFDPNFIPVRRKQRPHATHPKVVPVIDITQQQRDTYTNFVRVLGALDTLHDFCGSRNKVIAKSVIIEYAIEKSPQTKLAFEEMRKLVLKNGSLVEQLESLKGYKAGKFASFEHNILEFTKKVVSIINPAEEPVEAVFEFNRDVKKNNAFMRKIMNNFIPTTEFDTDVKNGLIIDTSLISFDILCENADILQTTASQFDKEGSDISQIVVKGDKDRVCVEQTKPIQSPYGLSKAAGELMSFNDLIIKNDLKLHINNDAIKVDPKDITKLGLGVKTYTDLIDKLHKGKALDRLTKFYNMYGINTSTDVTGQIHKVFDIKRFGDWGQIASYTHARDFFKDGLSYFVTLDRPAAARAVSRSVLNTTANPTKVPTLLTAKDKSGYKFITYGQSIKLTYETQQTIFGHLVNFRNRVNAAVKRPSIDVQAMYTLLLNSLNECQRITKANINFETYSIEVSNANDFAAVKKRPVMHAHIDIYTNIYSRLVYMIFWCLWFPTQLEKFAQDSDIVSIFATIDALSDKKDDGSIHYRKPVDDELQDVCKSLLNARSKIETVLVRYNMIDDRQLTMFIDTKDVSLFTTFVKDWLPSLGTDFQLMNRARIKAIKDAFMQESQPFNPLKTTFISSQLYVITQLFDDLSEFYYAPSGTRGNLDKQTLSKFDSRLKTGIAKLTELMEGVHNDTVHFLNMVVSMNINPIPEKVEQIYTAVTGSVTGGGSSSRRNATTGDDIYDKLSQVSQYNATLYIPYVLFGIALPLQNVVWHVKKHRSSQKTGGTPNPDYQAFKWYSVDIYDFAFQYALRAVSSTPTGLEFAISKRAFVEARFIESLYLDNPDAAIVATRSRSVASESTFVVNSADDNDDITSPMKP